MILQLNIKNITLRSITSADNKVLYNIYCSTRLSEMQLMSEWTNIQKQAFLKLQFDAQRNHYLQHYKGADFWIIEKNRKPIGRLYLHKQFEDNSIRIIDITLLPAYQNKGIGKRILLDILGFAAQQKQPVTLHVETTNKALALYKSVGFQHVHTNQFHYFMRWNQ